MWWLQWLWLGQEAQAGNFGRQESVQDEDQGFGARVQLQGLWRRTWEGEMVTPCHFKGQHPPLCPSKTDVAAQV